MPHLHARDGARLGYLDIGRGPAVVMLPGFGMRAAHWLPFVLPFARHRRFLLPDFRGFGGSRRLHYSGRDALRQNADDVHDLLQALRPQQPKLVGFSIGAASALEYQRSYGFGRIAAYLHVEQTPCIANKPDWSWGLMGAGNDAAFERARVLLRAFAGVDRQRPFRALPAPLQQQFWSWFGEFFDSVVSRPWWRLAQRFTGGRGPGSLLLRPDAWPVYLECIRSFVEEDYDFRESLRRVAVPTWVMIGGRSGVFPAEGQRRIADYAVDARLVEVNGCGHVLPAEAPARFLYTLGRFLAARA